MRLFAGLLMLPLLAGCAGYAADYVRPRESLLTPQLARFGFGDVQAQCMAERLGAALSVWQTRQLVDVAAAATPSAGAALDPAAFVTMSRLVTDEAVPQAVAAAAAACNLAPADTGPAAEAGAEPIAERPAADAAPPADPAWVNLGSAVSGQAIAVEGASIRRDGTVRRAWFRLTNPGQSGASAVHYHLNIDCAARTINPLGFRQIGPGGETLAVRDYGPDGEGALPVEAGTVMELAFLALCT